MNIIYILGTAGSGKSLLTASLKEWLLNKGENVITFNLDPGVKKLFYDPDIDVRQQITIEELMEKYTLGPNGALITAIDLVATEIDTYNNEIEDLNPNYVLVDTPGQMEIFAFRAGGAYIINELTTYPKVLVHLFDSTFSIEPLNYVANMFLAAASYARFLLPQIYLLSKIDLIKNKDVKTILKWSSKAGNLEETIKEEMKETKRLMSRGILNLISHLGLLVKPIPISSKNGTGFLNFHATLTRIFSGGEEFL